MKKALDPQVKRISQTTVRKIKPDIKKKQEEKIMPTKKEPEDREQRKPFDDLRDIVNIKKQKAVANELDSLIYDQTQERHQREGSNVVAPNNSRMGLSPLEVMLAENPEKVRDMSVEDATKLSMFTNKSGGRAGSDVYQLITALGLNKNNNNSNGGLTEKILGILLDKVLDNGGNKNNSSSNDKFMEFMMQQNLKTQELLMNLLTKQNAPAENKNNNDFMKELFGIVKNQGSMENSFLRDKLREMEMRIQGGDSLGEAKRVIDYIKTFKGFFGNDRTTPETMDHELKLKQMDFDQDRQLKEERSRTSRMEQIGSMINNTIETFGKVLGEPVAEAAKAKIEQYTESAKHPSKDALRISPTNLQKEIDLGDLEALEADLAEAENPLKSNGRSPRFKVYQQ
jgi:hypothetical protein